MLRVLAMHEAEKQSPFTFFINTRCNKNLDVPLNFDPIFPILWNIAQKSIQIFYMLCTSINKFH